jgi:hypothetical protein
VNVPPHLSLDEISALFAANQILPENPLATRQITLWPEFIGKREDVPQLIKTAKA